MKVMVLTVFCCLAATGSAAAQEGRPDGPRNRSWLCDHLVKDMTKTNNCVACTFDGQDFARAHAISNSNARRDLKIDDDDVRLLADYYCQTRSRAEEDMRQFQRQYQRPCPIQGQAPGQPQVPLQVGPTDEELKEAKDERDAISKLGGKLADGGKAVAILSQMIYASLPGFCLGNISNTGMVPPSYFNPNQANGALQYVGPVPANNLVLANPYLIGINIRVNAARLNAARQAEWLQYVRWWHSTHPGAGGVGTGSVKARVPIHPVPILPPGGTATGPAGSTHRH